MKLTMHYSIYQTLDDIPNLLPPRSPCITSTGSVSSHASSPTVTGMAASRQPCQAFFAHSSEIQTNQRSSTHNLRTRIHARNRKGNAMLSPQPQFKCSLSSPQSNTSAGGRSGCCFDEQYEAQVRGAGNLMMNLCLEQQQNQQKSKL